MKNIKRYIPATPGTMQVFSPAADEGYVKFFDIKNILKTPGNTTKDEIIQTLKNLSEVDRNEILSRWCGYCGDENPNCQCWNDE